MQKADSELEMLRMKRAKTLLKNQAMPETIIEIKSVEEFNKILKDYPNNIVIIDFWAVWCGPCMFFAPVFKKLHEKFKKEIVFVKVNVDENNAISTKYNITGIPTTLFIKNGDVINKVIGALNYEQMKQVLEELKKANN
ncbi:Thiol-disulfide oxidoreductase ResA [subsurface metagenome]